MGDSTGKKRFAWNRDRTSSVLVALFALLVLHETGKIEATFTKIGGGDPGSRVFPYGVCIIMLICAVGKFITSNKPDKTPFLGGKKGVLRLGKIMLAIALYVFLLDKIGFLVCTPVFAAILVYLMKDQYRLKPIANIVFAIVLTAALYVLFHTVLGIRLPEGTIWELLGLL